MRIAGLWTLSTYEEIAVDRETFDDLMRRIARQTSRRAALATLVGGVLLVRTHDEGEATRKAKRRKARKRQNKGGAFDPRLKPSGVTIQNTSPNTIRVSYGQFRFTVPPCDSMQPVDVPPGQSRRVSVGWNNWPFTQMYVQLNGQYWFGFDNLPARLPDVAAAFGGQLPQRSDVIPFYLFPGSPMVQQLQCTGVGLVTQSPKGLNVNEYVDITSYSQTFRVRRLRDTNYKEYLLTVPTTFPAWAEEAPELKDEGS